ncbi:hypothetical protein TSAR_014074 [Trichomalopsis sarcophagae]|uniref:Uncharacterized protein n=1 Tax=Trichomalopsis sarcophagae TaxID=543379 RepID=A0A232EDT1_9HYME|nr:hypothetical protein TSAR_014074 [Trichomalopsis sarcophagae]
MDYFYLQISAQHTVLLLDNNS